MTQPSLHPLCGKAINSFISAVSVARLEVEHDDQRKKDACCRHNQGSSNRADGGVVHCDQTGAVQVVALLPPIGRPSQEHSARRQYDMGGRVHLQR